MAYTPNQDQIRTFSQKSFGGERKKGFFIEIPPPIVALKKLTEKQDILIGTNDEGHILVMTRDEWDRYLIKREDKDERST